MFEDEDEDEPKITNRTLCQSYVFCEAAGKTFFVSTINRRASCGYGDWYAETMVWEWDNVNKLRGGLVGQKEGMVNDVHVHSIVIQRLFETGLIDEPE
mgnify:CR=1